MTADPTPDDGELDAAASWQGIDVVAPLGEYFGAARRGHEHAVAARPVSLALAADLLDGPDPANLRRLRAETHYRRRSHIRWTVFSGGDPGIPDLRPGVWPYVCTERLPADDRVYVCTRRGGHTGRHAAAVNGRVVAVWGVVR